MWRILEGGQVNVVCKGLVVNTFYFSGQVVCVTLAQLCGHRAKAGRRWSAMSMTLPQHLTKMGWAIDCQALCWAPWWRHYIKYPESGLNLIKTFALGFGNLQAPECWEKFVVLLLSCWISTNAAPVYLAMLSKRRGYLVSLCIWVGMMSFSCRRRHRGLLSASYMKV